ncbi:MAG: class II glutamine amidotransferase [Desulfurella sp.]|jgi:glutamate synthase domain-containing protein 1|uniref:class II glutamine amidotransferase n=1 Tax=Desulfurella TaxID=33001 RepID=UPI0003E0979B|nr:glutamine amidotransferase family protein [Desulfurella multipotens]AHF97522.1 hypothetical protein DESACE_08735 [Desulfurella acetivorans A63]PMP64944.1 MAG: hypothetical protein C0192_05955 [Desulfurella multipotens]
MVEIEKIQSFAISNDPKDASGCGIFGIFNTKGDLIDGNKIVSAIDIMRDRGNGLGSGYAAYGIYPEFKNYYALHLMIDDDLAKRAVEDFLERRVMVAERSGIPTRGMKNRKRPMFFVYFVLPRAQGTKAESEYMSETDADEFINKLVFFINENINGAFVISSGKNMGIFKGIGYPDEIANFFRIERYKAYCWTAHNRFPTNTPGWWGGAHPFGLLDWTVVHNGEISSYGANKRYLEMHGYKCTQKTDTEAIVYLADLIVRKHKIPIELLAKIFSAPLWEEIERMPQDQKKLYKALRIIYGRALLNGPFSILLTFKGGIMALNDRIKLRPLVVGKKDDVYYFSSEEAAIKHICSDIKDISSPDAGEPVIARLTDEAYNVYYGVQDEED